MQRERKIALRDSCAQKKSQVRNLNHAQWATVYNHLLVNDKYKTLYCFVPKAGCSNWMKVLKTLDEGEAFPGCDALVHLKDVKRLDTYSPEERLYRIMTYYKFAFTREPMDRLLSAYNDKFQPSGSSNYFHQYVSKHIVKRYWKSPGRNITGADFTWPEFVQYINGLKGGDFNEHWAPYDELCQPCVVNYDFLGHYENFEDESNYVIRQLGAEKRVAFPQRQYVYHPSLKHKVESMFKLLNTTLRQRLLQVYGTSYDLFHYKRPVFLRSGVVKDKAKVET